MVLEFITSLRQVIKPHQFTIDSAVSKLHYTLTVGIIFLFCILVTSRQYFGDPISCMPSMTDEIPEAVLNTYCWVQATYTLPSAYNRKVGVYGVPHHGVGTEEKDEKRVYHNYYQWVWFVLLLQALFFFVPRYTWQVLEARTIKKLILDLNIPLPIDEEKRERHCRVLANYLKKTKGRHSCYAVKYYLCEFLNFVNVVSQLFTIDVFLGGSFLQYGVEVLRFTEMDPMNRTDPMIKVFPRVTKCVFHKFGPSGGIQRHDALCILPLNIVNEKIFLIMWLWFIVLSVVTGVWLIWLFVVVFLWRKGRTYVLQSVGKFADSGEIEDVCGKIGFGDWLLLYFLCVNMDGLNFDTVVHCYHDLINASCVEKRTLT